MESTQKVSLAAFLNARLEEDEALARQAAQVAGPDWTWETEVPEGCDYPTDYIKTPDGTLLLDTMGGIEGVAPHVALHDPARTLRDVEAKRRMLEELDLSYPDEEHMIRLLAAVYSDHPDYDPEWAPS
jgi:hypothetical protein